jgi:hypothetical protein
MHPDLVQRVLATYYQARTFFDGLADAHGTTTTLAVRRVTVQRIGGGEDGKRVFHRLDVAAGPTPSAHNALALARWRAELDGHIEAHVAPFLDTLAEALPVADAPFGSLSLTHQQPLPGMVDGADGAPPPHRLLLTVNGLALQNGDNPAPNAVTWPGLLRFLQAAHHLPSLVSDHYVTNAWRPGVTAASEDDAEVLWRAAGYTA